LALEVLVVFHKLLTAPLALLVPQVALLLLLEGFSVHPQLMLLEVL